MASINKSSGFIKVWRSLKDKAYYKKDSAKVHLWIHILIKANHKGIEGFIFGKPMKLSPGQFITGRKALSEETGINESKIERILTYFDKIEQQIEQQKSSTSRLISVKNWCNYQISEQQSEQQVNNDRTTSEQRVNTNNNDNNDNTLKNKDIVLSKIQKEFYDSLTPFVEKFGKDLIRDFYNHWSEPNKSKTKIRWQLEKTWDTNLRLLKWESNQKNFSKNGTYIKNNKLDENYRVAESIAEKAAGLSR